MTDYTADTAAAMLRAVRAAELSCQPLAVGLADALEELMDRGCVCEIEAIVEHLRNFPGQMPLSCSSELCQPAFSSGG